MAVPMAAAPWGRGGRDLRFFRGVVRGDRAPREVRGSSRRTGERIMRRLIPVLCTLLCAISGCQTAPNVINYHYKVDHD